jgi:SAM-dependent methyltransferase
VSVSEEPGRKHWNSVAARWHLYASPLRPCAEDLSTFGDFIRAHGPAPSNGSPAALILGVTPEIATMWWPTGTFVTGVDRSQEMIDRAWPGDRPGVRRAICADWFALPDPARSYDLVLADGSFNLLGYPDEMRRLIARLRGTAQPGALLVTRTFTRPAACEGLAALDEAARAGAAGGFHAFKFRLAMALQSTPGEGVSLDDIWRLWQQMKDAIPGLSTKNKWAPDVVGTIELFRGKQMRLSFPSRGELITALEAAGMTLLETRVPGYELGERCASLAWRF